ncbi:MAG: hypothetical protein ACRDYD_11350 [Acidimicrobiales bacterium]
MLTSPTLPSRAPLRRRPRNAPSWRRRLPGRSFEALAVLASPAAALLVLHLRAMAPTAMPDPSMHTIFLLHPHDVVERYAAVYAHTARMREGYRVGFLVPARLADMAFGAIPGFLVTRYVFALVAVAPAYLLLRRLYGRAAGAMAALVILSSPVVVTAWGTDYPDSAVVSYAIGGLAMLAMSSGPRWRRTSLALGSGLLVMAAWSHGVGMVVAGVTVVAYLLVRLLRDRARLGRDVALLAGAGIAVTAALAVASKVLLLGYDFVLPTVRSLTYLSLPAQVASWHSRSWRWAPYDTYLLVPPAVLAAWAAAFVRGLRRVPTPQLLVALATAGQLAAFAYMQLGGDVQMLEDHYFSSALWGAVSLTLAVTLAQVGRPLLERPFARWLPAALVLAVPLAYEADPRLPALVWWPAGAALAAAPVAVVAVARMLRRRSTGTATATLPTRPAALGGAAAAVVCLSACVLALTAAPIRSHKLPPGAVPDPPISYATALGGPWGSLLDSYRVTTRLPAFVGDATYNGEQILVWWKWDQLPQLLEPLGIYHAGFNLMPSSIPDMIPANRAKLASRKPAELLFMTTDGSGYRAALAALAPYRPRLVRRGVLRSGSYSIHVWLVILGRWYRSP